MRGRTSAFGAVLYEMFTGRKAFAGKSQASLLGSILQGEPPAVSRVQPLAPPAPMPGRARASRRIRTRGSRPRMTCCCN